MKGVTQDVVSFPQGEYELKGQWDNWQNLLDMANAIRYGFSQYRLPMPGEPIDVQEAQGRMEHIDQEWAWEHSIRGGRYEKPCPEFSKCSVEARCYLHSILQVDNIDDHAEPYWGSW